MSHTRFTVVKCTPWTFILWTLIFLSLSLPLLPSFPPSSSSRGRMFHAIVSNYTAPPLQRMVVISATPNIKRARMGALIYLPLLICIRPLSTAFNLWLMRQEAIRYRCHVKLTGWLWSVEWTWKPTYSTMHTRVVGYVLQPNRKLFYTNIQLKNVEEHFFTRSSVSNQKYKSVNWIWKLVK